MKLTEEQIEQIELYLESKKLFQLDLKEEVLDHMVSSVTDCMGKSDLSFIDAFELERIKWKEELESNHSLWLGEDYKAPKIATKKCIQIAIKMYVRTVLVGLLFTVLLYLGIHKTTIDSTTVDTIMGYTYFSFLVIQLFYYAQIIGTRINSSFRDIYKSQGMVYIIWSLLFNPMITGIYGVFKGGEVSFGLLFMHTTVLIFTYNFYELYVSHLKLSKLNIV
ncbi:MAG: hypothetical protein V3U92_04575 [Cellulophaga sp.]